MASQHLQHMHKALAQMNLQIHHVLSDITGLTGLAIVDAIIAGERDPAKMALLREPNVRADTETISQALVGDWRREHLFVLKQSRQMFESYRQQIIACDRDIESLLATFAPCVDPEQVPPRPGNRPARKTKRTAGSLTFDHRNEAYKLFGVDVTRIPGLDGCHGPVQRSRPRPVTVLQFGTVCLLARFMPG
jgi:hypothetical protein